MQPNNTPNDTKDHTTQPQVFKPTPQGQLNDTGTAADSLNGATELPHNTGLYSTNPSTVSNFGSTGTNSSIVSGDIKTSSAAKVGGPKTSIFRRKKFWLLSSIILLIVAALSLAYVFIIYIPNKPQIVWSIGLDRTGDQFEEAITKLSSPESIQKLQKNQITADGKFTEGDNSLSIDLNSIYDSKDSDTNLEAKGDVAGESNQYNLSIKVKSHLPDKAIVPNLYINFSGIKELGLDVLLPGIDTLENTWISIEQDTLMTVLPNNSKQESSNLTQDEAISIAKDSQGVLKEYVFTKDLNKSVLIMNQYIATEDSEGITANHYLFSINKNNAKLFCEAYVEKLGSNSAVKRLTGLNDADYGALAIKTKESCGNLVKSIDESKTYDLWIDKKHKIIHKIRLYTA